MNEKQQRLKIYKKALLHYRLSFWIWFMRHTLHTDYGFCTYLHHNHPIFHINENWHCEGRILLMELLKQKPSNPHSIWWWHPNRMWPRIQALKKAIKLCK